MKATFLETSGFTDAVTRLLPDVLYAGLQHRLMENPDAGDVMSGCGGLRKIRAADPKRQKGRRGGARVIYLHVPAARRLYMIDIYGKDEKDDLSAGEKRVLRQLAARLKLEAIAAYQRWLMENS
jgi:hypothetical protein